MLFDTDQPELTQAAMSINSAINQHLFTHNDVKEVNSILSKTLSQLKKHLNLLATALNEYHQSDSKEQAKEKLSSVYSSLLNINLDKERLFNLS